MPHNRTRPAPDTESFLYPNQVADLLGVSPKTITRWAKEGKLPFQRTLGGHRRYDPQVIHALAQHLAEEVTG